MAILRKYSVPSKLAAEKFEQNILAVPEIDLSAGIEIKMLISQIDMYDKQVLDIEMEINQTW